jgi:flagellar biosynthesis anti-sigma factor FlgM
MNEINPAIKTTRRVAVNRPASTAKSGGGSPTEGEETQDRVTLSSTSRTPASRSVGTGGEVRQDLVNKYKAILQKGSYRVKSEELADKMVQKIRDDKNTIPY